MSKLTALEYFESFTPRERHKKFGPTSLGINWYKFAEAYAQEKDKEIEQLKALLEMMYEDKYVWSALNKYLTKEQLKQIEQLKSKLLYL